jgi:tetratricopeptide (TPR) repeat protein
MNKSLQYALVILLSFNSVSVLAGSIKTGNPKRERSNSEAMTELIYKKFVKMQELIAEEQYVEARAGLEQLTQRRINSFERAKINQFIGWIDSAEEKFVAASKRLQIAIDADALSDQAHFSIMLQKAQMLAGDGKYQDSINALKEYYKVVDEIKDSTFYFEASIYAQMDKFRLSINALKKAISLEDKPNESWHYLLYNLHMQLSEFKEAAVALEDLIKINPNKETYWTKLSEIYFSLKKDDEALAVLAVADKNGMITDEKGRMRLFKMYAFLGNPYKAGKVLEKGLNDGVVKPSYKKWDDLGRTWYSAAEMDSALNAYNQASKLATDGKIDFQRAYIYFDREDWPKTKQALLAAIEKGGLKDKKIGTSWLLLGMAESEMNNQAGALKALRQAMKYSNTRSNASQWIDHIEKSSKAEKARIAAEQAIAAENEANAIDG